ncbi:MULTISPECIES: riboflavin synthase [Gimesia]|jgi:riboflavin synthase|uniref:Riboflavin synthase n=1 Tax=Gimesia benthica TaxID=2608982 RepID=A0A6I6ABW3_9PLAN|nr:MULTISPECIES: riboflavin synthase [Gimesia]MBN71495.1 riboflavin synthase [Gimesia sp.]MCR9234296.1 riboflavin synthase [bacterium]KAA0135023.1 riboflavin synthase [Gimesia chilikensis]QDT88201.1 Riboflavin synthase [Gimesia chilikensis]QGQ23867.1 riboflavin synthase [Gimesia benthica]
MFTGLVEGQGTVQLLEKNGSSIDLTLKIPELILHEAQIGDSVAINGCCLTVVEIAANSLKFQAGAETLAKTNLGLLTVGDAVNLERPLAANGRLGGHFVQGHVDGVGSIKSIDRDGEWITMWFEVPEALALQMVPKGSVTVDGISLTIVGCEASSFSIALIPHTLEVTTLGQKQVGSIVNIETDILGKYVSKLVPLTLDGINERR